MSRRACGRFVDDATSPRQVSSMKLKEPNPNPSSPRLSLDVSILERYASGVSDSDESSQVVYPVPARALVGQRSSRAITTSLPVPRPSSPLRSIPRTYHVRVLACQQRLTYIDCALLRYAARGPTCVGTTVDNRGHFLAIVSCAPGITMLKLRRWPDA